MKNKISKTNQAAIEALRRQIQPIAFDANIYDRGIGDYPHAENCSNKRKALLAAIVELQGMPATTVKKIDEQPKLF